MAMHKGLWGLHLAPTWGSSLTAREFPRAHLCCAPTTLGFLLPKTVPGLGACVSSSPARGTPSLCLPSEPLFILQNAA